MDKFVLFFILKVDNENVMKIVEKTKQRLKNFTLTSLSKRAEILDYSVSKIEELFQKGIKAKDIARKI
mgnify:CR=1 FL=1